MSGQRIRVGAAVLLAGLACLASVLRVTAAAPPRPGTAAPAFTLPIVANGKGTLSLASLRGHAVYLNFFASWCGPCKAEVPYIAKLSSLYAKDGLIVIGIDELESRQAMLRFVGQLRLPYRIVADESGAAGEAYGLAGLPLSVFIAPQRHYRQVAPRTDGRKRDEG